MERLNVIQRCLQQNDNYTGLKKLEQTLQMDMNSILNKEAIMWFQRSRF